MNVEVAAELGRTAIYMTVLLSMPAMLTGLAIGLAVSLLQSITSVQEQTLSFVPKIVVTLVALLLTLPWMFERLMEYTVELYQTIPTRF